MKKVDPYDTEPLVKGGQGREADEVEGSMYMLTYALLALAAVGLLIAIFA